MNIDELINELVKAKNASPHGGNTDVCLCEDDREYTPIKRAILDNDNHESAVFLVCIQDSPYGRSY